MIRLEGANPEKAETVVTVVPGAAFEEPPRNKKNTNHGVITRLRNRLQRRILATFRPNKLKESQLVPTLPVIPQVLFPPPVSSPLRQTTRDLARMRSVRSILDHSALSAPTSRPISPPPSTEYDLSSDEGAKSSLSTSSAESILSWDRARTRDHEADASSISICSRDSVAVESSLLSLCSYHLNSTLVLHRTTSVPLLSCLEDDVAYVDGDSRHSRAITPVERKKLNHLAFRAKSR